ncbi:glycosyltransferase family 2 protein [Capillibacterium thermochitinicola]|uniref:glycosyltransferase family 2 protein n=1 Tax=Capillibacterium thermochitinicola TaxID=2699427 RepID=UPI002F2B7684
MIRLEVAAVIPAYNEAKNIGRVLAPLRGCSELSQVIVVSDGSTDQTAAVARKMGAQVIELPKNKGKGAAVMAGVAATTAEVILLLDADLIGLTAQHVKTLLEPIFTQEAMMTIGCFSGGRLATDLSQHMAPKLNGQRAIRRELLVAHPELAQSGYGFEVVMNRLAQVNRYKVVWVDLPHLSQVLKEEKLGLARGVAARMRMYWQILRALVTVKLQ